ncbi:MAG: DnaA regulatory inactivator Hda [Burkholderiales bacterium]
MRQLLLELKAEKPQTLDTFVVGKNAELMQLLNGLAARAGAASATASASGENFVYLWGRPGAGKTHLLHALARLPAARYSAAGADEAAFQFTPCAGLYLLDECDKLSEEEQTAAFTLFNQVRENNKVMIAVGAVAPAVLAVREDLRTRLGWGLVYQVHELTDEEKIAALRDDAHARGLTLSSGVLPYLITHLKRDMRSLSATLDALDRYSLETRRKTITVPLLHDLLRLERELNVR